MMVYLCKKIIVVKIADEEEQPAAQLYVSASCNKQYYIYRNLLSAS